MSAVLEVHEPRASYLAALQPPLVRQFDLLATAPGGVARLRELILTLAVQGKLVPQDPSDEPANVLLRKIRAEKDRLIAAGKIKRDKPQPLLSDDEAPFSLPENWRWSTVENICSVVTDGEHATPQRCDDRNAIPLVTAKNVRSEYMDYTNTDFVSYEVAKKCWTRCKPENGDILMVSVGATLGRLCVLSKARDMVLVRSVTVLRPVRIGVNVKYLALHLMAPASQEEIWSSVKQSAQPCLYLAKSAALQIALPPLAEQSRIVTRVEELMRLCDALESQRQLETAQHAQLLNTLLGTLTDSTSADELAANWQRVSDHFDLLLDRPQAVDALEQTILQLAVRGLLVPQDPTDEPASVLLQKIRAEKDRLIAAGKIKRDKPLPAITEEEKPFELPEGWVWARFPELGEFGRGKSKHRPRNDPALFNPPLYPVVQTGEVARANRIILEYHSKYSDIGLTQSRMWPAGTLCITIAANIADAAILGFDACFPDSVVGFVPAACIGQVDYFLAFMETARTQLIAFAPATAQKNINLEILGSMLIPIPPQAEMHRIVARVNQLRSLCADLRKRLSARQTTQSHLAEALVEV